MSYPVAKAVPVGAGGGGSVQAHAAPIPTGGGAFLHDGIREDAARDYLNNLGWPSGMIDEMIRNIKDTPYRFFIIDDSGSMSANDGNRLMKPKTGPVKLVKCSRWAELAAAMTFHSEFTNAAMAPSEFRVLNGGYPIIIGEEEDDGEGLRKFSDLLERGPSGMTPLCAQIREVVAKITQMAPTLRSRNQRVSVTIFTDGQASDGDMSAALRALERLPVWTVIRLCTDEEAVVDYWNNIDNNIELEMDVLDDLSGECEEVMSNNDWLTYGEQVHRLREFGCHRKELDLLDESLLSPDQMRSTLAVILGGKQKDYPHPEVDFPGLIAKVKGELARQPMVWSPRRKTMVPCIDIRALQRRYGKSKCSIM